MLDLGWRRHKECYPQTQPEPEDDLRVIRLYPPDADFYFIELLGFPKLGQSKLKAWVPIELPDGWFGLPCFRYMGLTRFSVQKALEIQ